MSICDSLTSNSNTEINCFLCKFNGNDDLIGSSIESYIAAHAEKAQAEKELRGWPCGGLGGWSGVKGVLLR